MTRRLLLILSLLLAGCGGVPGPEAATRTPDLAAPGSGLPLSEPSPTPTVTETPTPRPAIIYAPTETSTPYPTPATSPGVIQITSPGPLSKITSPLMVRGYVVPGANNRVRIELFGEDGRLLVRQVTGVYTSATWGYLSEDLRFEIGAVSELGRLTISVEDQYGRVMALNSVHVLLLSQGETLTYPAGNTDERCIVAWPRPEGQVSGGLLLVDAECRPFSSQNLVIELVDRSGGVLTTRLVALEPIPGDDYLAFTVDLPYRVDSPQWVRLVIRQSDNRIPGMMYLYSHEIVIYP
ncbi:MAG: hypothetical protein JXB85_00920 [Anaerolineales bacterium]|nr:hypothetical protein [Anaerolineales bacterium]